MRSCRVLELRYATSTTATAAVAGDQSGQIKAIIAHPGGGAAAKTLATYKYNNAKQLVETWRQLAAGGAGGGRPPQPQAGESIMPTMV